MQCNKPEGLLGNPPQSGHGQSSQVKWWAFSPLSEALQNKTRIACARRAPITAIPTTKCARDFSGTPVTPITDVRLLRCVREITGNSNSFDRVSLRVWFFCSRQPAVTRRKVANKAAGYFFFLPMNDAWKLPRISKLRVGHSEWAGQCHCSKQAAQLSIKQSLYHTCLLSCFLDCSLGCFLLPLPVWVIFYIARQTMQSSWSELVCTMRVQIW